MILFQPILAPTPKLEGFNKAFRDEAREIAKAIKADFESTIKYWHHKPKFEVAVSVQFPITVTVDTDDAIWWYVTEGTRPHIIRPRKAKALRFRSKYKAHTTPGVIGSQRGGASGKWVFARYVKHPGTKKRGLVEAIAKKWEPLLGPRMEAALDRAAAQSGHRM